MLTTGGENSPRDGTDVTCRHDVLMILPQEEREIFFKHNTQYAIPVVAFIIFF